MYGKLLVFVVVYDFVFMRLFFLMCVLYVLLKDFFVVFSMVNVIFDLCFRYLFVVLIIYVIGSCRMFFL